MSEIFLDTASMEEIDKFLGWGIGTGVTTNQKIFLKTAKGTDFKEQAQKILERMYPYPVSLEGPNKLDELIQKAQEYRSWGRNVVIKVPMLGNGDGLKAVKKLSSMGIQTNVTACMTINQAFLAASAGATYVSLFYNRMKDMVDEEYAINTIKRTMLMLHTGGFETELIIGSIRTPDDISNILEGQPDIITIPTGILKQMPFCEKTEETLKEFDKAWEEYQK